MSSAIREVRRRMQSTRQIYKVTAALQRVSAARFSRDRRAIENAQMYARRRISAMWTVTAAGDGVLSHPLMEIRRPVRDILVVLFGSERGLCGGFNAVLRAELGRLAAARAAAPRLLIVGQTAARRVAQMGFPAERVWSQPATADRAGVISEIAQTITDAFLADRCQEVHLVYAWFRAGLKYDAVSEQVLPAPFRGAAKARAHVALDGTPSAILAGLLPDFVLASLDQAFLNSLGAENLARQGAMARASSNAQGMLAELTVTHNRMRQEAVTREIVDLGGGGLCQ
ncbi:MAG: F0F1 ATP synthase subunit gamma [Lentisphaerae bacterium]|nr:F0F1 ATP synthase subunit gamma [Lentisphaerota bacterium]